MWPSDAKETYGAHGRAAQKSKNSRRRDVRQGRYPLLVNEKEAKRWKNYSDETRTPQKGNAQLTIKETAY